MPQSESKPGSVGFPQKYNEEAGPTSNLEPSAVTEFAPTRQAPAVKPTAKVRKSAKAKK